MTTAQVRLPPKLIPVFAGEADVRGAKGGRGSGKTRNFAKMTAVRAYMWDMAGREGIVLCGREYMNSLEDSSLEEIKAAIREEDWLLPHFDIGDKYVRTASGRIHYSFAGLDRNIDSIKSKSRILLCWVDEAEPVSEEAWVKLIPTLREEDSELWVTWNPERETSATNKRFGHPSDPRYKIIELNWRDNPKFPAILDRQRLRDKEERPEQYEHIWEGAFKTAVEGAYYAQALTTAKETGRITDLALDPLMTIRAYWDIGGSGAKADATAIWVCQFIGKHINVLDYYEARHQPLAAHLAWLRKRGYGEAYCILPHDGGSGEKVIDTTYEGAIRSAGFDARTIPNQGAGAAAMRIETARRLFPRIRFNAKPTEPGRTALGWYHEKIDDKRAVGLGPEHDWASHGCFHSHTEVLTRYGTQQIMNLPKTGEILTPCGWKRYINPRVTKRAARLVEVRFTSGYSVKCTPDHLFLTDGGWKSAESLTANTAIRSTWTKSRSISMAVSIACGQATTTYRAAARSFIGMLGSLLSVPFRLAVTSTIETATFSTTGSKISNAWMPASIWSFRGRSANQPRKDGSALTLALRPPNGTPRLRAGFGISATPSAPRVGRSGSARKNPASTVLSRLWRWFGQGATVASSALRPARWLRIESVTHLSETSDVWDITVPDGHWFSLANGAVVHNSDAFGLMCIDYEEPSGTDLPQVETEWVT